MKTYTVTEKLLMVLEKEPHQQAWLVNQATFDELCKELEGLRKYTPPPCNPDGSRPPVNPPLFGMRRIKIHCRHGETEVIPNDNH